MWHMFKNGDRIVMRGVEDAFGTIKGILDDNESALVDWDDGDYQDVPQPLTDLEKVSDQAPWGGCQERGVR